MSRPSPPSHPTNLGAAGEDDGPSDGYNAGAKVSVQELMNKDSEDESLRKYKEQLLGAAGTPPELAFQPFPTSRGQQLLCHRQLNSNCPSSPPLLTTTSCPFNLTLMLCSRAHTPMHKEHVMCMCSCAHVCVCVCVSQRERE